MRLGYTMRAWHSMLHHPGQGVERIRGRIDRHQDRRQKKSLGASMADFYGAVADWRAPLHAALGVPSPCPSAASFDDLWDDMIADLTASGLRVGLASYGGWNDGDRAFAEAIWCIVAHIRPERVVETGVAHGLTSGIILQGLERNGAGCGVSICRRWIQCSIPRSASPCRTACGPAGPTSAGQVASGFRIC